MDIIAVNTLSLRVSFAFELIDSVTGVAPVSEVRLRIAGEDQEPVVKDSGYILFLDLPESEYEVLVEARDYMLPEPAFYNPAALNLLEEVVTLTLGPRPDYPFPPDATLLYGTIVDEQGMGVPGVRVEVDGGKFDGQFATTDVTGRCVLFFDEGKDSRNLDLVASKPGYLNKSITVTIFQGQAVSFTSQIDQVAGPDVAVLTGRVLDVADIVVSQATVTAAPWGQSVETDCDGRYFIEQTVTGDESVTLAFSQDGFADQSVSVNAVQGAAVDTPVLMNIQLLPDTAGLGVEVVESGGALLQGAVVEIVEKSRAAMTNADGLTRFFFNDLVTQQEDVTIRVSKTGFVTRNVGKKIRQGRTRRQTVVLQAE